MAIRVDFHDIKRALDSGSVTPIQALHKWTTWALKQRTLEIKPYFEYVRETLPIVVWHKPDEEMTIHGYLPVTWTCATDFYTWADNFMGQIFSMGAHLRSYIAETDPEHAGLVLEKIMVEIQRAVQEARENPLPGHGGSRDGAGRQADEITDLAEIADMARTVVCVDRSDFVDLGQGGKNQANNVSLKVRHGNDPTYTLRRLARDRPDLLDRIEAGELSPNAAAVEAGFRRPMRSIPVDSARNAVRALAKVFDVQELLAEIGALADEG